MAEKPEEVTPETWTSFLALRNKRRAPFTVAALKQFRRECEKAGATLEDAMMVACNLGWTGFNHNWNHNARPAPPVGASPPRDTTTPNGQAALMALARAMGMEARPGEEYHQFNERVAAARRRQEQQPCSDSAK